MMMLVGKVEGEREDTREEVGSGGQVVRNGRSDVHETEKKQEGQRKKGRQRKQKVAGWRRWELMTYRTHSLLRRICLFSSWLACSSLPSLFP